MSMDKVTLTSEAIAAIEQGHLIAAIKLTREATGLGLKDSKEAVETYLDNHPELKAKVDASRISMKFKPENWAILIIAILLVAAYLLFTR